MDHNNLIKKLRLERGLSQDQLARGISQRSTLSSFENKGAKISYNTLVQYLDRMNVTLEEYQFMLDDEDVSEKRKISKLFFKNLKKNYSPDFEKYLQEKAYETDNYYYEILRAMYLIIMKRMDISLDIDCHSAKLTLTRYLDSIANWGRFELTIFINTLFIYDNDYIQTHFNRSVKRMKVYVDNLYFNKDMLSFLINGTQLFFERGSKRLFYLFLKQLGFFADEHCSTDAHLAYKVFSFLSSPEVHNNQKKYELHLSLEILGKENYVTYIESKLKDD